MSLFTEKERADLCYMHDNNPGALFDATVAAVLKKLAAGVSVEPFAYTDPLFVSVRQLGGFFTASNDKVGMFTVPLYTATAIAAARVQENERCLALMDAIGCDWRDAGDMAKFYATNYLCDAIRALLGKEQS